MVRAKPTSHAISILFAEVEVRITADTRADHSRLLHMTSIEVDLRSERVVRLEPS